MYDAWSMFQQSGLLQLLDSVWMPDRLMRVVQQQHTNRMRELGAPGPAGGHEWTNPCALNGSLRIWWSSSEDLRGSRNKTSRFEVTLPLVHGKLLTKLILGLGSPNHSINGVRGSRAQLNRLVLRALLLGNRSGQDAQSSYVLDAQDVLRFADALSSHDFEIEFCPQVASYVELLVYVSVPLMRLLVTAPGGSVRPQDRGRPNLRTLLNQFVGARMGERLPVPRPAEAWGNFENDRYNGLPPGWMPNAGPYHEDSHAFQRMELALAIAAGRNPFPNGVDHAFCSRANQNWRAGVVRMVQTANNLTMFALGFEDPTGINTGKTRPTDAPQPYYLGEPADFHQGTFSEGGPEWSLIRDFGSRAYMSGPHQGFNVPPEFLEMSRQIDIPFWYGIDSARVVHTTQSDGPDSFPPPFDRVASAIVARNYEGPPSLAADDGDDAVYADARDARDA